MQTGWYTIVWESKVFAGMSPNGRLIWEDRTASEPIQIVLFPSKDVGQILGLPEDAQVIHLNQL